MMPAQMQGAGKGGSAIVSDGTTQGIVPSMLVG